MQNENRLVPDFRSETVQTYTETYTPEGGTEQTATYKIGTAHPIIGGILDKLTWVRTHAAAVWWNKLANITLRDKITSMDGEIAQLNSKIDNHIMIRSVNSTVYSLPPHGHAEIKINIPNVDGYKALIGFYSGNSVNTSILPFTTSNIPNSDGNLIFGAYNTANETMGNVIFVVNILYVKL